MNRNLTAKEIILAVIVIGILSAFYINFLTPRSSKKAVEAQCMSNQKQISQEIIIYAEEKEIMPDKYVWDKLDIRERVLICPNMRNKKELINSYGYNNNLANINTEKIFSPNETILIADAKEQLIDTIKQIDMRHDDKTVAAFAYGHVEVTDNGFYLIKGIISIAPLNSVKDYKMKKATRFDRVAYNQQEKSLYVSSSNNKDNFAFFPITTKNAEEPIKWWAFSCDYELIAEPGIDTGLTTSISIGSAKNVDANNDNIRLGVLIGGFATYAELNEYENTGAAIFASHNSEIFYGSPPRFSKSKNTDFTRNLVTNGLYNLASKKTRLTIMAFNNGAVMTSWGEYSVQQTISVPKYWNKDLYVFIGGENKLGSSSSHGKMKISNVKFDCQ